MMNIVQATTAAPVSIMHSKPPAARRVMKPAVEMNLHVCICNAGRVVRGEKGKGKGQERYWA